jgi:hypothetical protein
MGDKDILGNRWQGFYLTGGFSFGAGVPPEADIGYNSE